MEQIVCENISIDEDRAIDRKYSILGNSLFEDDVEATLIRIPYGTKVIPYECFRGCTNLTSITIPDTVEEIEPMAFYKCYNLKRILLPQNLGSIRYDTFKGCESLEEILIPNSVSSIEDSAFEDCYSLSSIVFQSGNEDGTFKFGDFVFSDTEFSEIRLFKKEVHLGNLTFFECLKLRSFFVPNVVSTKKFAFFNCTSLDDIKSSRLLIDDLKNQINKDYDGIGCVEL